MSKSTYKWTPEYAIPPGCLLEEYLEVRGYSQAEFARRCGRSSKLISQIIVGKALIDLDTALQFEKVLGLGANVWVNMESTYRLQPAKDAESKKVKSEAEWEKTRSIHE